MSARPIAAIVADFDGTLSADGEAPPPAVLAALARAREAGLRIVVASGRPLAVLRARAPFADGIVAENGAVTWDASGVERIAWPDRRRVIAMLEDAHIPHDPFEVIVGGIPRAAESRVVALVARRPSIADVVPNVATVMVVPPDVDKGRAAMALLARWGIAPEACAAVGDGENDATLIASAGLGAAVANAAPQAKREARIALVGAAGEGVVEFVDRILADIVESDLAHRRPADSKL